METKVTKQQLYHDRRIIYVLMDDKKKHRKTNSLKNLELKMFQQR